MRKDRVRLEMEKEIGQGECDFVDADVDVDIAGIPHQCRRAQSLASIGIQAAATTVTQVM